VMRATSLAKPNRRTFCGYGIGCGGVGATRAATVHPTWSPAGAVCSQQNIH
jgi:hypothetical protein